MPTVWTENVAREDEAIGRLLDHESRQGVWSAWSPSNDLIRRFVNDLKSINGQRYDDRDDNGDSKKLLMALNKLLERWRDICGSMNKLKKLIEKQGICLKNGQTYGSAQQLKKVLKRNKELRVKVPKAKNFNVAKNCLVKLNKY